MKPPFFSGAIEREIMRRDRGASPGCCSTCEPDLSVDSAFHRLCLRRWRRRPVPELRTASLFLLRIEPRALGSGLEENSMLVSKECQLPVAEAAIDVVDLARLDPGLGCALVFLRAVYPIRPIAGRSALMTSDFAGRQGRNAPMRWMTASGHAYREQELRAAPPGRVFGIGLLPIRAARRLGDSWWPQNRA